MAIPDALALSNVLSRVQLTCECPRNSQLSEFRHSFSRASSTLSHDFKIFAEKMPSVPVIRHPANLPQHVRIQPSALRVRPRHSHGGTGFASTHSPRLATRACRSAAK